jgi:hypothetical protein
MSADYVTFAADYFTRLEVPDVATCFNNLSHELMSHYHGDGDGLLSPFIPVVYVEISPADARAIDLDQDVIVANCRFRNVLKPKA